MSAIPVKFLNTGGRGDVAGANEAEAEFVNLFRSFESPLLGFAYQMVKDEQLAQDIVQEAFMRLQAHYDEVRQPKAWLYTTVRRLAIDDIRRSRKIVPFASSDSEAGRPSGWEANHADDALAPDEQAVSEERTGLLRVCIERLAPRERTLVQLKFIDELSYKDIAAKMGMTVGHVGYCLHHALKSLELKLKEEGVAK